MTFQKRKKSEDSKKMGARGVEVGRDKQVENRDTIKNVHQCLGMLLGWESVESPALHHCTT